MARVFISHSSKDETQASGLITWLASVGFEQAFLDFDKHAGIAPGEDWERRLYHELERAQAMVLILTSNWFASKWCFAEFTQGRALGKAIFAFFDWGARMADIIAAIFPERCKALVSVSGYLIGSQEAGKIPLPPPAELQWWYQYYFATERGRVGYDKYRHDFAKLIWQIASPQWKFDDATFDRSATSFDNPDHVAIVIHNYRWRLALAQGEPRYDDLEKRLAEAPVITVPAITLEGDANGAPHVDSSAYAKKFSGKYAHRTITGGIGHNLPQEAPQAFAQAVIDVDRF